MPRSWFIKSKRGVRGPVSSDALRELALSGQLSPRHAVSRDEKKWFRAGRVKGLEFPFESSHWYIRTNSGKVGPVSLGRLKRLANTARIISKTAISPDGENWIRAKQHPRLRFYSVDKVRWFVSRSSEVIEDPTGVHFRSAERYTGGPFSLRDLAGMAKVGELIKTDQVSIDGQYWMKAKCIFGMQFAAPTPIAEAPIVDAEIAEPKIETTTTIEEQSELTAVAELDDADDRQLRNKETPLISAVELMSTDEPDKDDLFIWLEESEQQNSNGSNIESDPKPIEQNIRTHEETRRVRFKVFRFVSAGTRLDLGRLLIQSVPMREPRNLTR